MARKLSPEFPIHICARSNNRERFPVPMDEAWAITEDYLFLFKSAFQIEIINYLLMPNHIHMIIRDPSQNLSKAMEYFMRETSRELSRCSGRINRQWGQQFHSSIINSSAYFFTCYRYVYRNPVSAGLAESVADYPYSSLAVLLGKQKSSVTLAEDFLLMERPESTLHWLNAPDREGAREQVRKSLKHSTMKFHVDRKKRKPATFESQGLSNNAVLLPLLSPCF